ncbi:MAG: 4Fe-4S dicluster domain-containing protein, partial [Thiobacillus sp.]|nr:4Fe-4S dicluster domain-containing protein [Thiobacillus sp.]
MSELKPMSEQAPASPERRRFVGAAAATAAGLTIAPGVILVQVAHGRPEDQAASSAVRWGMLVDATKCANGCNDCVTACSTENGWTPVAESKHPKQAPQWIRKLELQDPLTQMETSLPMLCQHCGNAPCETVCPVLATVHSTEGLNMQVYNRCVGT